MTAPSPRDQWPPGLGRAPALHVNRVVCLACATVIGRPLTPRCANGPTRQLSRPSRGLVPLDGGGGGRTCPGHGDGGPRHLRHRHFRSLRDSFVSPGGDRCRAASGDYGGEKWTTEDKPGESGQPVSASRHVQLGPADGTQTDKGKVRCKKTSMHNKDGSFLTHMYRFRYTRCTSHLPGRSPPKTVAQG
ncbi:Hypp955 [Branchiostoma lanceolatum]|uniref:Hypp955 protein n=1 Tax=Branchiostoma lanceolatum TaxID=7740 RepID=A0A8J9ZFX1_BRALA|nr:Hypp955 [Branchiostoma lanceolatum]